MSTRQQSVTDLLLGEGTAYALKADSGLKQRTMLYAGKGGQFGWAPNYDEWIGNQAYVTRPLVCILLRAPRVFELLPNPEMWIGTLKGLLETHAKTIDGFNATMTVQTVDTPFGGGGEVQHEYVNVTREASKPSITFIEKYGRPVTQFFEYWITYGMMSNETKFAMASALFPDADVEPTDLLADWYTATCLFMEPDPLHKTVNKAWITGNMFPTTAGEVRAKRDLTSDQEILELSIEFTGLSQYGLGVNEFAQKILDQINKNRADPYMRPATWGSGSDALMSADVEALNNIGYKEGLEKVGTTAIAELK